MDIRDAGKSVYGAVYFSLRSGASRLTRCNLERARDEETLLSPNSL